jgi:sugar phosphate isomerase/epimerase
MKIGAQFYTIRDFCKTTEGLSESLKKVADIGYREVQLSGVCDYDAQWMNDQLKECGLTCAVTHISTDKLLGDTDKVIEEHKTFGCNYIGIGALPNGWGGITEEIYGDFVKKFKPVASKIAESGMKFMYHNHDIEFQRDDSGKLYFDRILEDFSRDELGITMDTYWVQAGGGDVIWWIDKLAGRIPCVHLKDMSYYPGEGKRMAPVGYGNMNFDGILAALEKAGAEHLLVEQDNCYGEDPFECLKKSYEYLKAKGLE